MRTRRTTRCCSAVALTVLLSTSSGAQSTNAPLSLVPTRTVWTLPLNNQLTVPPAYDGSRAFFSIESDRMVAYDLTTGTQKWLVPASPLYEPAAGDGLVFLAEPGSLRALRADDGSTAWQLPLSDKPTVGPVWDNGWLVVATEANEIIAFRAADGLPMWRHVVPAPAHARPALAADRVYVPLADGRVVAIKVDTGDRLWDRQLGGPGNDILALDQRLYVGSQDNFFYCLLAVDGSVDWRWRTGGDVIGQPIIRGSLVYFLSLDNVLRALHHTSGVQRWRASLPVRPITGPAVAADVVIVSGLGASLPAYNLTDGKLAGELPAGGESAAPPYAFIPKAGALPIVITISRDIAKGATVTAATRSTEPRLLPMAPLPNLMPMAAPAGPR